MHKKDRSKLISSFNLWVELAKQKIIMHESPKTYFNNPDGISEEKTFYYLSSNIDHYKTEIAREILKSYGIETFYLFGAISFFLGDQ